MDSLGFKQIRILRRVGGGGESKAVKEADNKRFGLGAATPHERVLLMEKLERGESGASLLTQVFYFEGFKSRADSPSLVSVLQNFKNIKNNATFGSNWAIVRHPDSESWPISSRVPPSEAME
jgi:hypothetical protein